MKKLITTLIIGLIALNRTTMKHKIIVSLISISCFLLTGNIPLAASEDCKAQVKELTERVELLELELEDHEGKSVSYPISTALWGAGLTFTGHKLIKATTVLQNKTINNAFLNSILGKVDSTNIASKATKVGKVLKYGGGLTILWSIFGAFDTAHASTLDKYKEDPLLIAKLSPEGACFVLDQIKLDGNTTKKLIQDVDKVRHELALLIEQENNNNPVLNASLEKVFYPDSQIETVAGVTGLSASQNF